MSYRHPREKTVPQRLQSIITDLKELHAIYIAQEESSSASSSSSSSEDSIPLQIHLKLNSLQLALKQARAENERLTQVALEQQRTYREGYEEATKELDFKVVKLEAEVRRLRRNEGALEKFAESLRQENAELRCKATDAEFRVMHLEATLRKMRSEVGKCRTQAEQAEDRVRSLEFWNREKDGEIERLKESLKGESKARFGLKSQ